ncbi:MAG: hypothetical protein GXZ14_03710 [Ruminococcaceae bacterium]|nr:hypothetical protein [Oscillospiraceae bacterium]
MTDIFRNTSSHWVRYSQYEFRSTDDGVEYIFPVAGAMPDIYDPLKDTKEMVLEMVNVGILCMNKKPEEEIRKAILRFVTHYGLLGFMTALPTTPNFMNYESVYLPINHFVKEEVLQTEEYLAYFFPFEKPDLIKKGVNSSWIIEKDNIMMALAMTMGDKPLAVNMGFQREYGERYDWLRQQFKDWAFAATTLLLFYEDADKLNTDTKNLMYQGLNAYNGAAPTYHIALMDTPILVWDFHSLLLGVQMSFFTMLTDQEKPLRLCKHCQKVFIAKHPNAVFCSPRCKNQYNVYKSRAKRKEAEQEDNK